MKLMPMAPEPLTLKVYYLQFACDDRSNAIYGDGELQTELLLYFPDENENNSTIFQNSWRLWQVKVNSNWIAVSVPHTYMGIEHLLLFLIILDFRRDGRSLELSCVCAVV